MGRPINKRYLGTLSSTDGGTMPKGDSEFNIRVECDTGNGAVDDGFILAQKGTNKFKVSDGTTVLDCRLVDKATASLVEGEMVAFGTNGSTGERITLKKLFNRTVVDFNNNRFTWEAQDDSTETIMVLTAI
jgi:hypothetical protein